ncbi:hypothetical protein RvY_03778 [Ramazzottius varieornatus]|uniref:Uncharacterized protein n=1 Tax=Ramazzottius varieornatus TaxID=947166 RepID=A0A1D1UP96_RAMVA|nr:hypothetical protein RvY_03778 [Ramazzottius varieornatus]
MDDGAYRMLRDFYLCCHCSSGNRVVTLANVDRSGVLCCLEGFLRHRVGCAGAACAYLLPVCQLSDPKRCCSAAGRGIPSPPPKYSSRIHPCVHNPTAKPIVKLKNHQQHAQSHNGYRANVPARS